MKSILRTLLLISIISICFHSFIIGSSAEAANPSTLMLGDTDGDGEITITDCTRIQRDIAQITKIPDYLKPTADVDADGQICILDATHIQKWLAQLKVNHPIGSSIGGLCFSAEGFDTQLTGTLKQVQDARGRQLKLDNAEQCLLDPIGGRSCIQAFRCFQHNTSCFSADYTHSLPYPSTSG